MDVEDSEWTLRVVSDFIFCGFDVPTCSPYPRIIIAFILSVTQSSEYITLISLSDFPCVQIAQTNHASIHTLSWTVSDEIVVPFGFEEQLSIYVPLHDPFWYHLLTREYEEVDIEILWGSCDVQCMFEVQSTNWEDLLFFIVPSSNVS